MVKVRSNSVADSVQNMVRNTSFNPFPKETPDVIPQYYVQSQININHPPKPHMRKKQIQFVTLHHA